MDVRSYANLHADFPHETTADQWFSESQFESYRRLGELSVKELGKSCYPGTGIAQFFVDIKPSETPEGADQSRATAAADGEAVQVGRLAPENDAGKLPSTESSSPKP